MIGGWRACDGCGASWALAEGLPCPCCGEDLEPTEPPAWTAEPERIVPPALDLAEARKRLKAFVAPVAFPVGGLVADHTAARLVLVYRPCWLVAVDTHARFALEAGFELEGRSQVERYELGRWTSKEVTERRLHWEPREGRIDRRYEDLAVPVAAPGLAPPAPRPPSSRAPSSRAGGEGGQEGAVPLRPELLEGPIAVPEQGPGELWPVALELLRERVATDCAAASGAASVRALELEVPAEQAAWTWLLVPVFLTWYRDEDGRRHLLVVDGVDGRVTGPRLASATAAAAYARTASLLAVGLGVAGTLVGLLGLVVWVLQPVAALCLVAALGAGARAVTVPYGVTRWNRREG